MDLEQFNGNTFISPVVDPFKKECIKSISMWYFKNNNSFSADVDFIKGNTEGTQKFKADSFDDLYFKVSEFVKQI